MRLEEAIVSRRSIRSFLDKAVPQSMVDDILSAAANAPTAGNQQLWHFIVLTEPRLIEKACRLNIDAYWGTKAPLAVVVAADIAKNRLKAFWEQGMAAATQNILLLAHDRGLGATWTGVYPETERVTGIRRLIGAPESIVPFSLVIMGYPKVPAMPRAHPVEGRIHYNRFHRPSDAARSR